MRSFFLLDWKEILLHVDEAHQKFQCYLICHRALVTFSIRSCSDIISFVFEKHMFLTCFECMEQDSSLSLASFKLASWRIPFEKPSNITDHNLIGTLDLLLLFEKISYSLLRLEYLLII